MEQLLASFLETVFSFLKNVLALGFFLSTFLNERTATILAFIVSFVSIAYCMFVQNENTRRISEISKDLSKFRENMEIEITSLKSEKSVMKRTMTNNKNSIAELKDRMTGLLCTFRPKYTYYVIASRRGKYEQLKNAINKSECNYPLLVYSKTAKIGEEYESTDTVNIEDGLVYDTIVFYDLLSYRAMQDFLALHLSSSGTVIFFVSEDLVNEEENFLIFEEKYHIRDVKEIL